MHLVIPALFFLVALIINVSSINVKHDEVADEAVNAIQILNAKEFTETLGPYSRFEFHHPGPISYYYYAITEPIFYFLKSDYSKHIFAQYFLNVLFFFVAMIIVRDLFRNQCICMLFIAAALFVLYPLDGFRIFVNTWGPAILILPFLVYVLAILKFAQGNIKYILVITMCGIITAHNHLGIIPTLGVLLVFAVITYIKNRPPGDLRSRKNIYWLILTILIFALTSVPPVAEQLANFKTGNMWKIAKFLKIHQGYEHSIMESFIFVLNYYSKPLAKIIVINPILNISLLMSIALFGLLNSARRTLVVYMISISVLGLFISTLSAAKVVGDLMDYLFWFQYVYVIILYFVAVLGLIQIVKITSDKIAAIKQLRRSSAVLKGLFGVFLIVLTILVALEMYRMPAPKYDGTVSNIVSVINPSKQKCYLITVAKGSIHHMRWPVAAGVVLKLRRMGYRVHVPDEWLFMYGKNMKCTDCEECVKIHLLERGRREESNNGLFERLVDIGQTTVAILTN